MVISGDGVEEIRDYLSAVSKGGDKWLAFNTKSINERGDLSCFKNYSDAVQHCMNNMFYAIKPISNVIRIFGGHSLNMNAGFDKAAFDGQLRKYNLEPFGDYDNFRSSLMTGELCAAFLKRRVEPQEVKEYHLYKHLPQIYGSVSGEFGLKLFYSTPDFKAAITEFDRLLLECSHHTYKEMPGLRLVGELKSELLELAFDGYPMRNTGFLIKTANRALDNLRENAYYRVEDFRDFFIQIKQPVLTQFNNARKELEFFNLKNEQLNPDVKLSYMALSFFSGQKVKFSPAAVPNQNIKQNDKGDSFSFKIR